MNIVIYKRIKNGIYQGNDIIFYDNRVFKK